MGTAPLSSFACDKQVRPHGMSARERHCVRARYREAEILWLRFYFSACKMRAVSVQLERTRTGLPGQRRTKTSSRSCSPVAVDARVRNKSKLLTS